MLGKDTASLSVFPDFLAARLQLRTALETIDRYYWYSVEIEKPFVGGLEIRQASNTYECELSGSGINNNDWIFGQ